jgi:hypothetical protein
MEVLLSRTSLDLGPSVSYQTSKHPIETQKLSPLLCSMRVYLTKTGVQGVGRDGPSLYICTVADNVVLRPMIAVRGR